MTPLFHVPAIVLVEDPAAHESTPDAAASPGLDGPGILRIEVLDGGEIHAEVRVALENAADDANMEVGVRVERPRAAERP